VISNAVDLLRRRGSAEPDLEVEVNVSAKSFTRAAFVEQVETEITSSGIPPESLVFGIPAVAAASETAAITEHGVRLANLGCRFALNNFGTGPTPFARLAKLPIDSVKIDGRLVRHLAADTGNKALIGGVAGLVDGMPTTVGPVKCVAMHVSNAATVAVLRECGVDYGQGSYLGRPLPLSELS
jgi:EAL domain-containing protein (putative c-di-GMP-specific phosphodiesterase class I)